MSGGGSSDCLRTELESRSPAEATLKVIGELDLVTAPRLREELARHHAHGVRVVLDLSELRFMDSTGLVLLMESAQGDGAIALRRDVNPAVARLLEVTNTERLFVWLDAREA